MGHLFSRAFKRITQGSQSSRAQESANQQPSDSDRNQTASQPFVRPMVGLSEAIPVGQSIDSAEYAAFEEANKQQIEPTVAKTVTTPREQQGVEEAVIKIQALVRGHLTRKALKADAAQNQHSPNLPPTSLGQSQFDEATLMSNPPAAVFLPSSPLGSCIAVQLPSVAPQAEAQQLRTTLESIAEVIETANVATGATSTDDGHNSSNNDKATSDRKKLAALTLASRSSPSPSKLEMPQVDLARGSASPATPSESAASIDLNCDTPASASIDIVGHHIRPASEMMASILHHKLAEEEERLRQQQPLKFISESEDNNSNGKNNDGDTNHTATATVEATEAGKTNSVNTPDSLESEEAAAIRIQSAFRGYRTRKNSPYRTRSPNHTSGKLNALRQDMKNSQTTRVLEEEEEAAAERGDSRPLPAEQPQSAASDQADLEPRVGSAAEELQAGEQLAGDSSRSGRRESRPLKREGSHSSGNNNSNDKSEPTTEIGTLESSAAGEQQQLLADILGSAELDSSAREMDPRSVGGALASANTELADNRAAHSLAPRASLAAGNSLDTDSSVLGAVISLNETTTTTGPIAGAPEEAAKSSAEEAEELDSGGRLVGELEDEEAFQNDDESALEEAANQLEAALEEATEGGQEESAAPREEDIEAEARRVIDELESDDIERRDPRGQRSPEIRMSEPQLIESVPEVGKAGEDYLAPDSLDAGDNKLGIETTATSNSGRSSPVLNSSAEGSNSSAEEGDANSSDEAAEGKQASGLTKGNNAQRQQQQQPASKAANKKRNNRNKRKGKK